MRTSTEPAWQDHARWLIGRAVLAPSSHNTQPWRFRLSNDAIDLWADRTRALPANDPEDRELIISCGCALMNLRASARSIGWQPRVQPFPDASEPDWLARIWLTVSSDPPDEDAALAPYIERRRTWRKRFSPRVVSATAVDALTAAARAEGAWLYVLSSNEAREQAAALVAEGDILQWSNPVWRAELAAWMHPRRRGEGLVVPALAVLIARLMVRAFDLGVRVGAKDREAARGSPVLALLGTERDDARAWLLAGQALQRLLLVGCEHDLLAAYLNQPVQVAALRPRVHALAGRGFTQILLRLGHPIGATPATPRRALDAVIA